MRRMVLVLAGVTASLALVVPSDTTATAAEPLTAPTPGPAPAWMSYAIRFALRARHRSLGGDRTAQVRGRRDA
jgi:hypothetical protein